MVVVVITVHRQIGNVSVGSVLVRTSVQQLAQWVPPRSLASDIPAEAREILEYDALWRVTQ